MALFDAIKPADVRTVGNLAVAGGVALGVYEVFGSQRPNYLWPGLLVAGGLAAHVATVDGGSVQSVGQGASGAATASVPTCVAKDLGQQREREGETKALPYVITGVAILAGGLLLKALL